MIPLGVRHGERVDYHRIHPAADEDPAAHAVAVPSIWPTLTVTAAAADRGVPGDRAARDDGRTAADVDAAPPGIATPTGAKAIDALTTQGGIVPDDAPGHGEAALRVHATPLRKPAGRRHSAVDESVEALGDVVLQRHPFECQRPLVEDGPTNRHTSASLQGEVRERQRR